MQAIAETVSKYNFEKFEKPPRHWKADIVDQIIAIVGPNKKYNFVYWLTMIKRSRRSWGDCMVILKNASQLPGEYNRGGFITNQLKPPKQDNLNF